MRLFNGLLICAVATLVQVEAFAAKPAPPPPPPPPSPGTACASSSWTFPAMAYSRGVYSQSGAYQKTQIFVADSRGTCEVLVYDTGDYTGKPVYVSFHYDPGSSMGTLVWKQDVDNGKSPTPGRVVKLARFQVNADGAVMGLPISATTIYRLPVTLNYAIDDVELSQDGTRVAFTEHYKVTSTGPWTLKVKICDLPDACQTKIEEALSVSAPRIDGSHQLTIGQNAGGERIYLLYKTDIGANRDVADLYAVDNQGEGIWTDPSMILARQYMAMEGDTATWLDTLDALSRPGEADRVLISSSPDWPLTPRVAIYNAAQGTVDFNAGTGYRPTWTLSPSIGNPQAPNILVTSLINYQTSPVREIDADEQLSITLPVNGYGVDAAD